MGMVPRRLDELGVLPSPSLYQERDESVGRIKGAWGVGDRTAVL